MSIRLNQLHDNFLKMSSRLSTEIGHREADESVLNNKVADLTATVDELESRMGKEMRAVEGKAREGAGWSEAEKRRIVMQISAVQTELKQSLEAR